MAQMRLMPVFTARSGKIPSAHPGTAAPRSPEGRAKLPGRLQIQMLPRKPAQMPKLAFEVNPQDHDPGVKDSTGFQSASKKGTGIPSARPRESPYPLRQQYRT